MCISPKRLAQIMCTRNKLTIIALTTLSIFAAFFFLYINFESRVITERIRKRKECFFHDGTNSLHKDSLLTYFDDILTSVKQPRYGNGIFFIESKCSAGGCFDMKPRVACVLEAAARLNPDREIFMVFMSPIGIEFEVDLWPPLYKSLQQYPNINFRNVQLKSLSAGTPIEEWIDTGDIFRTEFISEHTSDLARLLVLYKYGGTYLDEDYMLLKNLSLIHPNFIGTQYSGYLNNAVLDFSHEGIGHEILHECLREFQTTYNPKNWGFNGPDLLMRVLAKICKTANLPDMTRQQCRGFRVFPESTFYPLHEFKSELYYKPFFQPNATAVVLNKMKNSIGFHFYNSFTRHEAIETGHGDAFDATAKKNCPTIYASNKKF